MTVELAPGMTSESQARATREVKEKFRELDTNRDGMLDFNELRVMLRRGREDITDREVRVLFDQIDTAGTGKVSFNEFVDFVFASKPQASAVEVQIAAAKDMAEKQAAEVWQVQIWGAEHADLNGEYEVGEDFNGRPTYDRAYPPACIFYGWTQGHKDVGWFIARKRPSKCPVTRYKAFNPSRQAELPHLCCTTWQTPSGQRDKRMLCCRVSRGSWDTSAEEGTCLPEELWPDECSDDDSDEEAWEGEAAGDAEDADWDDEWKHEVGEHVEDSDSGSEAEDEDGGAEPGKVEPFSDEVFSPSESSLGKGALHVDGWARLSSMHQEPFLFKKVADEGLSDDINCSTDAPTAWLLNAAAAVAEYPAWIQSAFGQQTKIARDAKYTVRLYHPGKKAFVRVEVDDFVPTSGGAVAYTGISADGEIWMPLLEKAFAKFCGSYGALAWGSVAYGMLYICGGGSAESWTRTRSGRWERSVTRWKGKALESVNRKRAEGVVTDGVMLGANHLWLLLREYMECCYPVACTLDKGKESESGLRSDRAYSIIGAREVAMPGGKLRLVRMRNPFSGGHWTGRWSDQSEAWQQCPIAMNQLRFMPPPASSSNATFWISFTDFLKYFEHLDVAKKSMPVQGCRDAKLEGLKRGLRKFGEADDQGDMQAGA